MSMKTGTLGGSGSVISKKFGSALTHRFGKHSIPRKAFQKGMYVENALLRESHKFSNVKNKYMTSIFDNMSSAEKFVNTRKSNQDYQSKEHKLGILTPMSTTRFLNSDMCNPESIDPRLKTLSAAGLSTNSDLQLIQKEATGIQRM